MTPPLSVLNLLLCQALKIFKALAVDLHVVHESALQPFAYHYTGRGRAGWYEGVPQVAAQTSKWHHTAAKFLDKTNNVRVRRHDHINVGDQARQATASG